ncbi:MAG TPA: MFS transporter [Pyrinomonadaceae bacterium]|jgi:FSR family fosmidomycin resistance protein-like MFS transporter|nr:MFS transporter [Pyrinomonadaceae bacterium]
MPFEHPAACATLPRNEGASRGPFSFVFVLLLIEFTDELLFGVREAAWPLVRDDLRLSYVEVGVLLSVPGLLGNLIELSFGILADVWKRRVLILAGGVLFAAATLLIGLSYSFPVLLFAFVVLNPASGAFVGLSQAALMDAAPARHEQNMARWTLFGSLGNAVGPVVVGAAVMLGLSWRWLFAGLGAFSLLMLAAAWRFPFPTPATTNSAHELRLSFRDGVREALRAFKRREVLRWLFLLQIGDFTYDVLRGFLALYFVDVVGASGSQAALAVIVWTCVGLPGDFLLVPLLERVRGLSYLRWSTTCVLVLFPAFLIADDLSTKLLLLGLLGFANAGWYSILKAQLYSAMPGRSGTVLTLGNLFGFAGDFTPLALGAFAQKYGLEAMMWLLLAGPFALLVGLPRAGRKKNE